MKTFTNYAPGARGINVKQGEVVSTRWLDPGQSLTLAEGEEVSGALPDLGKAPLSGDAEEASADLQAKLDAANARIAELEGAKTTPQPWMIAAAIGQLDAKSDDHWTDAGLPKVEAVNALLGSSVKRADIEAAAPDARRPAE